MQKSKEYGIKLIQRNLSNIEDDKVRHDSDVIASTIIQLICDELQFEDMQNDSQYLMLNSKLKESKRQIRKRERKERKFRKSGRKQFERKEDDSKFKEKYHKRIESIKESDEKTEERKKKASKSIFKRLADMDTSTKYKDMLTKQETVETKLFDAVSQLGITKRVDIDDLDDDDEIDEKISKKKSSKKAKKPAKKPVKKVTKKTTQKKAKKKEK